LLIALLIGAAGSFVAWLVMQQQQQESLVIAVAAPTTGAEAGLGQSITQGVRLLADEINQSGDLGNYQLVVKVHDDQASRSNTQQWLDQLADESLLAVIGHPQSEAAQAVDAHYADREIPLLAPGIMPADWGQQNPWVFRLLYDQTAEIKFLANYARNVVGEKTVSIIRADTQDARGLAKAFDATYRRFGTKIVHQWTYSPDSPKVDQQLDRIAAEISDKKLIGHLLILGNSADSARALTALRAANVNNKILAPAQLRTMAAFQALGNHLREQQSPASLVDGALVTTPILFDTAGEFAQGFRNAYIDRFSRPPDWLAASAYDAGKVLAQSLKQVLAEQGLANEPAAKMNETMATLRNALREQLANRRKTPTPITGNLGPITFDRYRHHRPPIQIGIFNGLNMVSAPIQLQPIREEGVKDYLTKVIEGKALYVNDQFMYKTNVVFAGGQLLDISEIDAESQTAQLQFNLWFRYPSGGKFDAENIMFTNAVEPIELGEPVDEKISKSKVYRRYKIDGKFYLNHLGTDRPYGSHQLGISFVHQELDRNNLRYVADVIGMGIAATDNLEQVIESDQVAISESTTDSAGLMELINRVTNNLTGDSSDTMMAMLAKASSLAAKDGWEINRAWISQETEEIGSQGDPGYLGYGKPAPLFSRLDLGMIIEPDRFKIRDVLPSNYFIHLAIFAFVGAVTAALLDRKNRGQFWRMQTLGLRLVSWPLLLLAIGNIILDYAIQHFSTATVDFIVQIYHTLFWIIFARLGAIAIERFVWSPLELKTGRQIPNVVRQFAGASIYLFALFGALAFVYDQQLTSILATSGLLAMIIGLAVQSNIANVFSGIVLNVERPFNIGDIISIGDIRGTVQDITWRTTRIRHADGYSFSMPNDSVSQAQVVNFTKADAFRVLLDLYVNPEIPPVDIEAIVWEALHDLETLVDWPKNLEHMPSTIFRGVEIVYDHFSAHFEIRLWVNSYTDQTSTVNLAWIKLFGTFKKYGVTLDPLRVPDYDREAHLPDLQTNIEHMKGYLEEEEET